MALEFKPVTRKGLSAQIADALRQAILTGQLVVGDRLPSESDLAERFDVSRPTVREALKRLAAQRLIRTTRGAAGGAFVHHISWDEAGAELVTTATLLISMNEIDFETACEARFNLERAVIPLAVDRRSPAHLVRMRAEIEQQNSSGLTDEGFCTSDVAFHRALIEAAGNPLLTLQAGSAVAAMQPLMNMITYTARDRAQVVACHIDLVNAVETADTKTALAALDQLAAYTTDLANRVRMTRTQSK